MHFRRFLCEQDKWDYLKKWFEYEVYRDVVRIKKVLDNRNNKTRYVIPDIVSEIDGEAFLNCHYLEELVIPNSVTTIKRSYNESNELFLPQYVKELYISKNLSHNLTIKSLSYFYRIINASKYEINFFDEISGVLIYEKEYDKSHDLVLSDNGYEIGFFDNKCAVIGCNNSLKQDGLLEIDRIVYKGKEINNLVMLGAEEIEENCISCIITAPVVEMYNTFAYSRRLKSVILPDTLKKMRGVFYNSNVSFVKIPPMLEEIGDHTFNCTNVKSIKLPNTIKSIGDSALKGLKTITLPKNINYLSNLSLVLSDKKFQHIRYLGKKQEYEGIIKELPIHNYSIFYVQCSNGLYLEKDGKKYEGK